MERKENSVIDGLSVKFAELNVERQQNAQCGTRPKTIRKKKICRNSCQTSNSNSHLRKQKKFDSTVENNLRAPRENMQKSGSVKTKKVVTYRSKQFSAPPCNFREISVYPTQENLFGERTPFLRPNIVDGAYKDVEHYLDVQFRLLREDFVSPLRDGLAKFLEEDSNSNKKNPIDNIKIFRNVQFRNPKVVKNLIGLVVQFDPEKKMKIKWKDSKRFMFGSLLLFTNDNFNHVIFGTVVESDIQELKKGEVIVTLHQQSDKLNIFESNFLMVESDVYFEPYKLVMSALQEFKESSFPMKKYIIHVRKDSCHPQYLLQVPKGYYNVNNFQIEILNYNSWPTEESLGLDKSQLIAFRAALTEEFVVIQGPPGTGKTYLGLKIAKVLLQNASIWNRNKTPILVVCYTNHALDQFLEGLLSTTDKIVRVGGQSKSIFLQEYNIREKCRKFDFGKHYSDLKKVHQTKMSQNLLPIKQMQVNLEELDKYRGIVSVGFMKEWNILSSQHSFCFTRKDCNEDDLMSVWLLEGFEEYYGRMAKKQKDEVFVTTAEEKDNSLEEVDTRSDEGIGLTPEIKPVDFHLGDIIHNVHYAVDMNNLEERIRKLLSISEELRSSRFGTEYKLIEVKKECFGLQQRLQYWRTCLRMNHCSEASYIRRIHSVQNAWKLSIDDRWCLYKDWLRALKNALRNAIYEREMPYVDDAKKYNEIKQMQDLEVMQDSLVVGMTTTSAARLNVLLQALKPRIVIVEEAAEVLEPHVVVSLTDKCEHVILIGDHKQLRPSPADYNLAHRYNFDISLFERMVRNGIKCHCLEKQHRMRPEIAQLIAPTIYPDLKNHLSVYKYPTVRGITKSVFFLTHNVPEQKVNESTSYKNPYEADFILALCRHLMWQGYKPEEITVLATYKDQVLYMKQKQGTLGITRDVHITSVDNYQGEENKIILLSLVRSNGEAKIGFLRIENRVCVALSRAKEGLYIIGNMNNLEKSSKIWPKIKDSLVKQQSFGTHLVLQCEVHPDQQTSVHCADDFKKVPKGGCSLYCKALLQCGHKCESICHVNDRDHKEYFCRKKCERIPLKCKLRHRCTKLCYEDCGNCETRMKRYLPCKHMKILQCYAYYEAYHCLECEEVKLPHWGQRVTKHRLPDVVLYPSCPDHLKEKKMDVPMEFQILNGVRYVLSHIVDFLARVFFSEVTDVPKNVTD